MRPKISTMFTPPLELFPEAMEGVAPDDEDHAQENPREEHVGLIEVDSFPADLVYIFQNVHNRSAVFN